MMRHRQQRNDDMGDEKTYTITLTRQQLLNLQEALDETREEASETYGAMVADGEPDDIAAAYMWCNDVQELLDIVNKIVVSGNGN
jgi:hypothetical protein